jgi:predicted esterase
VRRLREAGAGVRPVLFEGAHEWSDEVMRAASVFLHDQLAGEP